MSQYFKSLWLCAEKNTKYRTEKFPEHPFLHPKVVYHQKNSWMKIQNHNHSTRLCKIYVPVFPEKPKCQIFCIAVLEVLER